MERVFVFDQQNYDLTAIVPKIRLAFSELGVKTDADEVCAMADVSFAHARFAPYAFTNPTIIEATFKAAGGTSNTLSVQGLPGFPTRFSMKQTGYANSAKNVGAKLALLDEGKFTDVDLPEGSVAKKMNVAKVWKGANLKILMPKLRLAASVPFCGALKLTQSLLSHEDQLSTGHLLPQRMVDTFPVIGSDVILVDAIEAMHDGGETSGKPVRLGMMIIGTNALAVELVCAAALGFEPASVDFLAEVKARGSTDLDLNNIEILGDLSLTDVHERAKQVIHIETDPTKFPLPEQTRVIRSVKAKQAGVSSTLTEALYLIRNSGLSFKPAPFSSLIIGAVDAIPAGKDEYSVIAFLDDTSRGAYEKYGRIVRLPGRNITLGQLLNVIPYVLKIANFQSELGTELMLSKLVSNVGRLFSS